MKEYLELLKNPPEEARGGTRWWWYGSAVTREGISRQLEFMKDAGIGSVEIQVLYPLSPDDPALGIKNLPYFSPEFFDMLAHALEAAEEKGMQVDFTLGSSWPYGGPFITHEMSAQQAANYQVDICGPCRFSYDFTSRVTGRIIRLQMGRLECGKMLEETALDLTDRLQKKYLYGWEYGEFIENIEVPEGNWKVFAVYIQKYRQLTGIPAPNMEGYAMDHCRRDVTDYFLKNAGEPIIKRLGASRIRSFFCDSIEVEGHNWTEGLPDEFQKRRGYDLAPYLYALWGDMGDATPEIRHDFFKTLSELTLENFFQPFADWCRAKGSGSRVQAHGTWADILKAYATADIPEGETFGEGDRFEVNTVHRKLASSAGHLYGKPLISNESFTWLRMPRFMETLEQMKAAVDAIFLDGMNMIVNHGYAYTPEAIPAPGWAFYASSHICHLNTWWPYYKELGTYIQTVSAFLRRGRNVAEVAVYLPQADVWSENVIADLHIAMKLEEYIGKKLINSLNRQGYYFDYINDEALTGLGTIHGNGLEINENTYKVIILPQVRRLPSETALKLQEFVGQGGILVAAGGIPEKGCGYLSGNGAGPSVRIIMSSLFPGRKDSWVQVGKGRTLHVSDSASGTAELFQEAFKPDLHIGSNNGAIGYVHRFDHGYDLYFISNISSLECPAVLDFKNAGTQFTVMDLLEKKVITVKGYAFTGGAGSLRLEIDFAPFQSLLVLFGKDVQSSRTDNTVKLCHGMDISGGWHFSIPSKDLELAMETVHTWETVEELKYYTGEGIYRKTLFADSAILKSERLLLSFEKVAEVAEIYVNGVSAGVLWKAPRELDIRPYLKEGANELMVKVVNLWINDAVNPKKEEFLSSRTVIDEWPYFADTIGHIRQKRLYNWREREHIKQPLPSGIGGKVMLKSM